MRPCSYSHKARRDPFPVSDMPADWPLVVNPLFVPIAPIGVSSSRDLDSGLSARRRADGETPRLSAYRPSRLPAKSPALQDLT